MLSVNHAKILPHLESLKNKTREPFLVSRVSKPRSLALPSLSHQLKKERTAIQEVNIFLNGFILSYRSRETLPLTLFCSQDEEGSVPNKQASLDRAGLTGNLVDPVPDSIVSLDSDRDTGKTKWPLKVLSNGTGGGGGGVSVIN